MSWLGVVTNAGREMYNRFSQAGESITMSSLKLGSGMISSENMRSATQLNTEKTTGVIESMEVVSNGTNFRLRANPASTTVGNYTLKEMGLYATGSIGGVEETVLFAYFVVSSSGEGIDVPLVTTFPDFMYILSATLVVDNTVALSFTVDTSSSVSYAQYSAGLATKVALDQGVANAGKFLIVNDSGIVVPTTVPFAEGSDF